MCPNFHCNLTVRFTFNCCSKYSWIIVKLIYSFFYCNFYIGLYKAIKCKPYCEITMESGTQLKTVHICIEFTKMKFMLFRNNIFVKCRVNCNPKYKSGFYFCSTFQQWRKVDAQEIKKWGSKIDRAIAKAKSYFSTYVLS